MIILHSYTKSYRRIPCFITQRHNKNRYAYFTPATWQDKTACLVLSVSAVWTRHKRTCGYLKNEKNFKMALAVELVKQSRYSSDSKSTDFVIRQCAMSVLILTCFYWSLCAWTPALLVVQGFMVCDNIINGRNWQFHYDAQITEHKAICDRCQTPRPWLAAREPLSATFKCSLTTRLARLGTKQHIARPDELWSMPVIRLSQAL